MRELFSIYDVSKSPAIFDPVKLNYINAEYIRRMSAEQFHEVAMPWIKKGVVREDIDFTVISRVLHPRCEVLGNIPEQLDFIDALPEYELDLYVSKKMKTDPAISLVSLREIKPVLEALDSFTHDSLHDALFALIERLGCKNGVILWPLRVALSGKQFTPGGGIELAEILGKEESLRRIEIAIAKLEANA